jgi:hydroxymethylglutaryl-CoA synthase
LTFFKPSRTISKQAITGNDTNEAWFNNLETEIEIHKEQPVFDGQYSNECYMERTRNAYFYSKKLKQTNETIYNSWKSIIMHLPYAFQAAGCCRNLCFRPEQKIIAENEDPKDYQNKLREISKSDEYKDFVAEN